MQFSHFPVLSLGPGALGGLTPSRIIHRDTPHKPALTILHPSISSQTGWNGRTGHLGGRWLGGTEREKKPELLEAERERGGGSFLTFLVIFPPLPVRLGQAIFPLPPKEEATQDWPPTPERSLKK